MILENPKHSQPELVMEIRFPARPDRLALVRDHVRSVGTRQGFDADATESMVLAVDEACQNVIKHGYDGGPGDIVLGILQQDNAMRVRIRDFAPEVDPARLKSRDLSDIRPGGLGLHFIDSCMDAAVYQSVMDGPGNVLEMIKYRHPQP